MGGYTYTQRFCQEYGQQPRWYNVRDGQAAYNGGNSDSGWLIVLEHGSHVAATAGRYVRNDATGDYVRYAGRYVQITGNRFRRVSGNNYVLDPSGNQIRLHNSPYSPGDATPDTHFSSLGTPYYEYVPGNPARGGRYVRWAHMAWCR